MNSDQIFRKRFYYGILTLFLVFLAPAGILKSETAVSSPTAPSSSKVVGKTVAIVNNDPIFMEDLEREAEPFIARHKQTAPEKEQTKENILALKKKILDSMIEEKLLLQESKSKKIKATKAEIDRETQRFKEPFMENQGKPADPASVEKKFQEQLEKEGMTKDLFNKRVEEQILKIKLIETEVRSKVELPKEEEVKKFFDKIQKKIAGKPVETQDAEEETDLVQISKYLERMTGEQVRIRHILIRSTKEDSANNRTEARKKLDGVLQRIKAGEDFAFLAKKFTDDPLSRERGGDLGFIAKGDLGLVELDNAIFSKLKEGEVSEIVETEIGFHLVKIIEKKAPHPLEYEDVSEDLKQYVQQRHFKQKLDKYLDGLRSKSSIKINPFE